MRHLSIDIETYSSVDISESGAYKYAESEDFEVLLFAYAVDFAPAQIVDFTAGEELPEEIRIALFDPAVIKHAFNAAFEWNCLSRHFRLDRETQLAWIKQWRCTMVHSYYLGYAGTLASVGEAVHLPEDKQKMAIGKALIRYFCQPCKPTKTNGGRTRNLPQHDADKWQLFKEYCRRDVDSEIAIYRKLEGLQPSEEFWQQWFTDQKINSRGVPLDLELIQGALVCYRESNTRAVAEFKELTGLENPKSNIQLSDWLREHGCDLPNLQKATVTDALKSDLPDDVRRALQLRQITGKSSISKYEKMLSCRCADGRARGMLQYYGASTTGRYAGRLIQLQNLPRSYLSDYDTPRALVKAGSWQGIELLYGSVPDILSQLIRTAFIPSKGSILLDADFSAIEARVIAWIADEEWVLEEFRGEGKIYEAVASQMFGVPKEKIKKGTELYKLRQQGKVAQLACAYGGGIPALTSMDYDHAIPEEQKQSIINQWRNANPRIVRFWSDMEKACIDTIKTGMSHRLYGKLETQLIMYADITYLRIVLPNGRALYYNSPFLTTNRFGRPSIGFYGMNQTTRKWCHQETYGGKLAENVTQAVARDLLAEAIERLESEGFDVLFHIHDEVVIDFHGRDPENALKRVYTLMSAIPDWAKGLPMAADGWYGAYFKKD